MGTDMVKHSFLKAFFAAAAITVLLSATCLSAEQNTGRYRIGLAMRSGANTFFSEMGLLVIEHQQANIDKYELLLNDESVESDYSKQIGVVEKMIDSDIDAIVITPIDSTAVIPVCKKAMDKGIVVVNIDNRLDDESLKKQGIKIPYVGPDNRKGAKLAGDYLAGKLSKGDKVGVIEGLEGAENAKMRTAGFMDAMKAHGINVVEVVSGMWEMDKGYAAAAYFMVSTPDIKALLCGNDEMAKGAARAVEEFGKTQQVFVVGYDNAPGIMEWINDGDILATVDQHVNQQVVKGIETALKMLDGEPVPDFIETPVELVTAVGE